MKNINLADEIIMPENSENIFKNLKLNVSENAYVSEDELYEQLTSLKNDIYDGENGYYILKTKSKSQFIEVTRLTDYTLDVINKVICVGINNDFIECKYKIKVKKDEQEQDVILSKNELFNLSKFEQKMTKVIHIISVMEEKQHRNFIAKMLSAKDDVSCIIEFKTAGYNVFENRKMFVTANNIYEYGSKNFDKQTFKLSENSVLNPNFTTKNEIIADNNMRTLLNIDDNVTQRNIVSAILKKLFDTIKEAYNNYIEPYIVISMGFMTLFLKQINSDFEGIPIVSLHGEAASGKSNLLKIISSAYGLKKTVLHSGMDTIAGILEDLENYANIPLLIDEIENDVKDAIKTLIKSVYGQTGRKKYNAKNHINTTLFFNTNIIFLNDLEYKNRCIELDFTQENFNCHIAEKFNEIQKYLSFVSAYIIENKNYSEIKIGIKNEEQSELLSSVNDLRMKRNFAIAITGLKLLLSLINDENITFEKFENKLKDYIEKNTNSKELNICRFFTVLKELIDERHSKLKENVDYHLCDNGLHVVISKKNDTFKQHFYNVFERLYKDIKPLDIITYKKLLIEKGAEMKNVHYSRALNSCYGIFLDYEKFDVIAYLKDRKQLLECFDKNNAPF